MDVSETPVSTEIAAYSSTQAAIAVLTERYTAFSADVTTTAGMAAAKEAYRDINQYSIVLEKARVKEKEQSLAYGRHVDAEAKRISAKLDALRLPIKEQIDAEVKREQREREAAVQREKDRIAAEAAAVKAAEEKALADKRAELALQQAAFDAQRAEQVKADAEARRKIEDEQRAARAKIEEEARLARQENEEADRVARLAREEAERTAKAARDAEEARLKVERDRIAAEARAVEESKRKEREAAEAKAKAERDAADVIERERLRLENELNDGYEMLATFVRRFGAREEFVAVTKAIEPFLRAPA